MTTDQGSTWEEIVVDNVHGILSSVQFSGDDLYSLLICEGENSIVKSSNYGRSRETILTTESLDNIDTIRKFSPFGDKIYILTSSAKLIVLNKSHAIEKSIDLHQGDVHNIEIITHDHFVLYRTEQVDLSTDGGISWTVIHDEGASYGGFESINSGFLIGGNKICQTGYGNTFVAAISITDDGGSTWVQTDQGTAGLDTDLSHSQNTNLGEWILSIDNEFFRLKKD